MTKKYEMKIGEEIIKFDEKTHAAVFRNFWKYFMEKDIEKMIEIIELVGTRTSTTEYFIAKNGAKKKNIFVKENYYIYTHLTPVAMEKAYNKFVSGWEGKYTETVKIINPIETYDIPEEQSTKQQETTKADVETIVTYGPQQLTDDTKLIKMKSNEEKAKDEIALELYGTYYEDLLPSQKGVISKKYKKQLKENA